MKKKFHSCVYCGSGISGTADHVPPRSFFPKPRPSNLITVPSCIKCNNSASLDEEFFLATFMFSDAGSMPVGRRLWSEKLNRLYFRENGVGKVIGRMMKPTKVLDYVSGTLVDRIALEINNERLERVVCKIIKGLYYHEYGEILNQDTEILCQYLHSREDRLNAKSSIEMLPFSKTKFSGVMEYRNARLVDAPQSSIWAIIFFNFAIFWIITTSKRQI